MTNDATTDLKTAESTKPVYGETVSAGKKSIDPFKIRPNKKRVMVLSGLLIVLLIIAGYIWWQRSHNTTGSAPLTNIFSGVVAPAPAPKADAPLTGLKVDPDAAKKPVVGVMIENLDPDARPQSGLGDAGIVYEALAEGGITRFLALFQTPAPAIVGPIRSLRPYYLDWGLEHNAPIVHAGGSQPALEAIVPRGLKNVEALVYGAPYFYRATDRLAPHNLYAKTDGIDAILAKLGFNTEPKFTTLTRKDDAVQAAPAHPKIDIDFSSDSYAVSYQFDSTSDSYARTLAGVPHKDRNTDKQIMVKNIVVEYVPTTYGTQQDGKPETDYAIVGTGKALVFEDGDVTTATWIKADHASVTKLTNSDGKDITFNRGNTWYEVIPTDKTVTY